MTIAAALAATGYQYTAALAAARSSSTAVAPATSAPTRPGHQRSIAAATYARPAYTASARPASVRSPWPAALTATPRPIAPPAAYSGHDQRARPPRRRPSPITAQAAGSGL